MQTSRADASFGTELVGVAALVLIGALVLVAFAIQPSAAVGAVLLGVVAHWDVSSRSENSQAHRVVNLRRAAYALATVGLLALLPQ